MDKLTKAGLIVFLILMLFSSGISLGILKGKAIKEAEYQREMEQLQHERDEYRDDLEQYRKSLTDKEKDYAKSIAIYENELRKLKDDFDDYVIRTDADNAQRLREYEERLKHYQSITRPEGAGGDSVSEVGASGCQRLAGVTAALDRNLIEGVTVVKQLYGIARRVGDESETLRMIVEADRKLINSSQSRLDNK
jgi:hypothetical protein